MVKTSSPFLGLQCISDLFVKRISHLIPEKLYAAIFTKEGKRSAHEAILMCSANDQLKNALPEQGKG